MGRGLVVRGPAPLPRARDGDAPHRRLRTRATPTPFQAAFLEAAQARRVPAPRRPERPGAARSASLRSRRNVVDGVRWNAALAYLDARERRPNLDDRGRHARRPRRARRLDGRPGSCAPTGGGSRRTTVILAAGAYFSPAILLRSGIGPEDELRELGIPVARVAPGRRAPARPLRHGRRVGAHGGAPGARRRRSAGDRPLRGARRREGREHVLRPRKLGPPPPALDLPDRRTGGYQASAIVFHMKPLSSGRVRLRSTDPGEPPIVERGFLSPRGGPGAARSRASSSRARSAPPSRCATGSRPRSRPDEIDAERYVRATDPQLLPPRGNVRARHGRRHARPRLRHRRPLRRRRVVHAHDPAREHEPDDRGDRREDRR